MSVYRGIDAATPIENHSAIFFTPTEIASNGNELVAQGFTTVNDGDRLLAPFLTVNSWGPIGKPAGWSKRWHARYRSCCATAGADSSQNSAGSTGDPAAAVASGNYGYAVLIAMKRQPSSSPTPLGGITPPTLVNPQNPLSFGADSTGGKDSTSAFQSALNAGDVHVTAGHYLISGHLYFPSNRHMQCDLDSSNKPTAFLQNPSQTTGMIDLDSTTKSSIFYCGFRGPNADVTSTSVASLNGSFFIRVGGPGGTGNQIVGNDFNGIGGYTGALMVYAGDSQQPPPDKTVISWNTAEHCGYYFLQITSGTNTTVSHNTLNDCSGAIEADNTGQANTGNVVDSNHFSFTYGVGCRPSILANCNGFDGLTCGAAPGPFDYGGNTCSNNVVDGSHPSTILTTGWTSVPPKYVSNTCTGNCTVNQYSN